MSSARQELNPLLSRALRVNQFAHSERVHGLPVSLHHVPEYAAIRLHTHHHQNVVLRPGKELDVAIADAAVVVGYFPDLIGPQQRGLYEFGVFIPARAGNRSNP